MKSTVFIAGLFLIASALYGRDYVGLTSLTSQYLDGYLLSISPHKIKYGDNMGQIFRQIKKDFRENYPTWHKIYEGQDNTLVVLINDFNKLIFYFDEEKKLVRVTYEGLQSLITGTLTIPRPSYNEGFWSEENGISCFSYQKYKIWYGDKFRQDSVIYMIAGDEDEVLTKAFQNKSYSERAYFSLHNFNASLSKLTGSFTTINLIEFKFDRRNSVLFRLGESTMDECYRYLITDDLSIKNSYENVTFNEHNSGGSHVVSININGTDGFTFIFKKRGKEDALYLTTIIYLGALDLLTGKLYITNLTGGLVKNNNRVTYNKIFELNGVLGLINIKLNNDLIEFNASIEG